jgi:AraC-like DNA-binding protein
MPPTRRHVRQALGFLARRTRLDLTPSSENDTGFDLVHADTLRFFPELVRDLGGDPDVLLRRVGIGVAAAAGEPPALGYRAWVTLLELAASELQCPDFGLRLARLQGGGKVFGPMGVVMQNSHTLGGALEYVAKHCHAHSLAARVRLERDRAAKRTFVGHEILLDRLPNKRQAVEQVLLLGHLNAVDITGGRARVREVYFRHQPLAPLRTYRRYFGCDVRFGQQEDGVFYAERDLSCSVLDADAQLYEIATSFIASRFTQAQPMHARVRALILQFMGAEDCSNERVAAELGLHPRTLHRRLKAEGKSFEGIKDEVRRDVALRYLKETDLPLTIVAEKLGYAEHSVLTRSCVRWFSASPSRLRAQPAAPATRSGASDQR